MSPPVVLPPSVPGFHTLHAVVSEGPWAVDPGPGAEIQLRVSGSCGSRTLGPVAPGSWTSLVLEFGGDSQCSAFLVPWNKPPTSGGIWEGAELQGHQCRSQFYLDPLPTDSLDSPSSVGARSQGHRPWGGGALTASLFLHTGEQRLGVRAGASPSLRDSVWWPVGTLSWGVPSPPGRPCV